jgi:hypothetical protein
MRLKDIPYATDQQIMQNILDVVTSLRDGHLSAHMMEGFPGTAGEIAKVLNQHIANMNRFRQEQMLEEVNRMGGNITGQFRDGANVVEDLLRGDLSVRMTCQDIRGEFATFRENLNELAERYEKRGAADAVTV